MLQVSYDKRITALLVIDPYNDFISEGGKGVYGPLLGGGPVSVLGRGKRQHQARAGGAKFRDDRIVVHRGHWLASSISASAWQGSESLQVQTRSFPWSSVGSKPFSRR